MVHATIYKGLKLSKKLARWVPKLMTRMKKERVMPCEAFDAIIAVFP
jgi:hypothetical protein